MAKTMTPIIGESAANVRLSCATPCVVTVPGLLIRGRYMGGSCIKSKACSVPVSYFGLLRKTKSASSKKRNPVANCNISGQHQLRRVLPER